MNGLITISLGEAAEIVAGITLNGSAAKHGFVEVPYLRVANVKDGYLDLRETKEVPASLNDIEALKLRQGDLLLTEGGDPDKLGRGTVWNNELPLCIHQNHIFRVRLPEGQFDAEYVSFQLGSPYGKSYFFKHAKKTTGIASINQKVLRAFPLIAPSLDVQLKVAAKIKAQLREFEVARAAMIAQFGDLRALTDAIVLNSTSSDPSAARLGDVLDEVKKGVGAEWASHPVLGATRDGLAPAKEQPGKQAPKYKPATPGTVFYNPMRILIGSIAMVDDDDTPGITSPDYVVLRGKPGVVDSRWFYYWLRSPLGAHCILSLARGAVRERMLFNRLAEGEIALPSYADQQRASAALKEIKPLKRALESRLSEINRLPQKILASAFEM
jgi:type I restriction enzyme S subunit